MALVDTADAAADKKKAQEAVLDLQEVSVLYSG